MKGTGFCKYTTPTQKRSFVYATQSRPTLETREPTEGRDGFNPRTNHSNSRPGRHVA